MEQIFFSFLLLPLFLLACIFSFTIPGLFLLSVLGYKKEKDHFVLATAVGLSLFLLLIYSFSWVQLHYLPLVILIVINLHYLFRQRHKLPITLEKKDKWPYSIIAFSSLLFVGLTWFSGWDMFGSMSFFGVNAEDGLIHISRIYNLLYNFPPTHPSLAGVQFNGYHYFYDLLLSRFVLFFHFSPYDLYFRYFSLFVVVFYGTSMLYFAKRFTKDRVALSLILLFAYLSSGFELFLSFFHLPYSSNFAQPLSLIFDPSVLLSVGILCVVFRNLIFLKSSYRNAIVLSLLLGVLCQLKIYAGLIGISVLVLYSLYSLIKYKVILPFALTNVFVCLLTIMTFFPNNLGSGSLLFVPFNFYSNFMQQPFFNFLQWENKRLVFAQFDNYIRIVILYVQAIIIFWFLTLGIRMFFLLDIRKLFLRSFWKEDYNFVIVVVVTFSLIIGSLFIQSISVFDTTQFFWIAMLFLSIPSGIGLSKVLNKNKGLAYILLFFFLITSIGLVYKEYSNAYLQTKPAYEVSVQERNVYIKVMDTVPSDGYTTVLHKRSINKEGVANLHTHPPSLVAALTGRSTYYESEKIVYKLDSIYDARKENLFAMHEALDICDQEKFVTILNRTGTPFLVTLFSSPCLATNSALLHLESSDKAVFYKLQEK